MPIERGFTIWEALDEYLAEDKQIYLLIEGAGDQPIPKELLFQNDEDLEYTPIYADTEYAPIVNVSPLLVRLDRDSKFLAWFIEEGTELSAGIILISRHGESVVLPHLQGMIEVSLPNYNFAAFRYHDPSVIDRYAMSVDEEAHTRLLGPLTAMLWPKRLPDKTWEWRELFRQPATEEADSSLEPQPVIAITEEQMEAFDMHDYKELARHIVRSSATTQRA